MDKIYGKDLRALRMMSGMTGTEFGKLLGVSRTTISQIETGVRPVPKHLYNKISELFPVGISNDIHVLQAENMRLKKEIDLYRKQLDLLKKIITEIGI